MARFNQQPRAQRRLDVLGELHSMQQFRKSNQRKVRAGQPTFTRALYLIEQRDELARKVEAQVYAQRVRERLAAEASTAG